MGLFPQRWQKILFAILAITTTLARLPMLIAEGIGFTLGFLLAVVAVSTIIVLVLSFMVNKTRVLWELGTAA
jgi:hypothetical protein